MHGHAYTCCLTVDWWLSGFDGSCVMIDDWWLILSDVWFTIDEWLIQTDDWWFTRNDNVGVWRQTGTGSGKVWIQRALGTRSCCLFIQIGFIHTTPFANGKSNHGIQWEPSSKHPAHPNAAPQILPKMPFHSLPKVAARSNSHRKTSRTCCRCLQCWRRPSSNSE